MKKTIFLILISIIFTASGAIAQVDFGIKGGLNFNSAKMNGAWSIGGTESDDIASGASSFHFGLYSTIDAKLFVIQPEVLYSMQKVTYTLNNRSNHELNMTYIQIPLLGRINFLEVLNVHAGPQFGIPISYEIKVAGNTVYDIKDKVKSMDLGFAIGAGADIPMIGAGITFRYIFGLTQMMDAGVQYGPTSLRNSVFQISASYAFQGK